MKIITAIENKKINEQLKNINSIKILNKDIQYKEGILEYLEKNNNIETILLKYNLPGQMEIKKLFKKILETNNKIKIIVIIDNKNIERIQNKNIKYIYLEEINIKNISKILKLNIEEESIDKKNKNAKIIKITGNNGSGKTVTTIIFSKILSENKKVLLIDENKNKTLTKICLKNINNDSNKEKKIIKIKNKIYLLNNNYLAHKKINILEYLSKIRQEFNYIIIDSKKNNKYYEKIINKNIYLLEANIIEIEKAKKYLLKNKNEIIINKKNINSVDDKIIEKFFNKKILGIINYSKNINLFINNNFNLNNINKKEKLLFFNIIKKI